MATDGVSPFDLVSDEILIKIFGNVSLETQIELRNRLALEQVCKRFQLCARDPFSWTTELIYDVMDETNSDFIRKHLEKIVERMPKITKMTIRFGNAKIWPKHVPKLIEEFVTKMLPFMDKFQLEQLILHDNACSMDFQLADRFLTSQNIKKVTFYGIQPSFINHCFEIILKLPKLTHLTLCNLHKCGQASRELLNSLINKLEYLEFQNCDWASPDNLTERLNMINESRRLTSLLVEHDKFDLGLFCKRLNPESVLSVERFQLKCNKPEFNIQAMTAVLESFKNLTYLQLDLATKCTFVVDNLGKQCGNLFRAACERGKPFTSNLHFGTMSPQQVDKVMPTLAWCSLSFNEAWPVLTMEQQNIVVRII